MDQRKFSIINEAAEQDEQIKKLLTEIDKLNATLTEERKENTEKVSSCFKSLTSCEWDGPVHPHFSFRFEVAEI